MNALDVEHLGHGYAGRAALKDLTFSIGEGGFCVLLGLNGAGKTTLISLLTGLYHARRGAVRIFGHSMRDQRTAALARLGVVFQQITLDLDLTVRENLAYHAGLHGLAPRAAAERQRLELGRFGLLDRRDERARDLSGGLKRRLEIARALLHRPRLLLLDEATVGLDLPTRQSLLAHVRQLCRDEGMAVLWATHLLDEIEPDDQLLVLHRGEARWAGTALDMRRAGGAGTIAEAFMSLVAAPS